MVEGDEGLHVGGAGGEFALGNGEHGGRIVYADDGVACLGQREEQTAAPAPEFEDGAGEVGGRG